MNGIQKSSLYLFLSITNELNNHRIGSWFYGLGIIPPLNPNKPLAYLLHKTFVFSPLKMDYQNLIIHFFNMILFG
jgi:hypothetical protein